VAGQQETSALRAFFNMIQPTSAKRATMTMQTQRQKALARWDNEGGAGPGGPRAGSDAGPRKAAHLRLPALNRGTLSTD
jgi:hypothetical protein